MKQLFIIKVLFSLTVLTTFGQTNSAIQKFTKSESNSTFYLTYTFAGLGSNMGSFQPTIRIKETALVYTYEQNSYWGKKSKRIDTVCISIFRQSSIDSIAEIVKGLRDTTIREYNYCIMSGGIHFLSVTIGVDTTSFQLSNTFDYTALKIANILNEYLPQDKQIWANEKMIKDAEDCWTGLMKSIDDKKKKRKSTRKKNGI